MQIEKLEATGSGLATRAIRLPNVCALIGASRTTIWRWVKDDPTFPKPFKLSDAVTVWDEVELLAWIDAKKTHRVP